MAPSLAHPFSSPSEIPVTPVQEENLGSQESAPKRALWLLGVMALMGLDSYFPQLSAASCNTQVW
ncbi:hypothetical protein DSO57_1039377 [Entomophthora muscae]|uniref:Uncharacterized protein n=1 Tax=Entomophthora muscae TaxID=34485 RepID=A0ACC2RD81_9FUNG|nr:hypothetical protein DSO57_1039377 [Entomophthora muscae]